MKNPELYWQAFIPRELRDRMWENKRRVKKPINKQLKEAIEQYLDRQLST